MAKKLVQTNLTNYPRRPFTGLDSNVSTKFSPINPNERNKLIQFPESNSSIVTSVKFRNFAAAVPDFPVNDFGTRGALADYDQI